jgi:HD superfamily phosphodiesterase
MNVIDQVENYVLELFKTNTSEKLVFHNVQHTLDVVSAAKLIGLKEKFSEDDLEILIIAAWFHDTGYLNKYIEHEQESIVICKEFFDSVSYDNAKIDTIIECIAKTKVPQNPQNKIESALCDADMFHLSQENFIEKTLTIRKELNANAETKIKKINYYNSTIDFFNTHSYHTNYGKSELTIGKEDNRKRLIELVNRQHEQKKKKNDKNKNEMGAKDDKMKTTARGVESMFRLTARNQISLSSIADNKANILITVNAIIISVIITMLVGKFSDYPMIIIPTIIFLLSSLLSIVFAILTTRPKLSEGKFTKEDIKNKNVNLLFFGNFYNMSLEDYDWAIREMMNDYDGLYGNMIMDQYLLGKVLAKKYKRLRVAYNIFMFGMIVTVVVFSLTILFYPN